MRKSLLGLFFCLMALPVIKADDLQGPAAVANNAAATPADISFMIIDCKYRPGRLTTLEFGPGEGAGFKVLDHMCYEGIVWHKVWDYLFQFNLPVWYVGEYYTGDKRVSWNEFKKRGGRHAPTLRVLNYDTDFRKLVRQPWDKAHNSSIKNYKGIIVFKRLALKHTPQGLREIEAFKRRNPQFLYLGDATGKYVSDKKLTDDLFTTPELRTYRPRCKFYPKEYTPTLAQQIKDDLQCEWFVIKPVNSGRGNGILMVNGDELDDTLVTILKTNKNHHPYDNEYMFKIDPPMLQEYWKYDRNSHFLVEEYAQSRDLWFNGKPYDPTMRVAFAVHHDEGKIHFTWLDAYWKRPLKALNEEGTFREKHISKHAPNLEQSLGWEIFEDEQAGIESLLVPMMEQLYTSMMAKREAERKLPI